MIKLITKHLKGYWWLILLGVVLLLLQAITDLYLPNIMANVVDKGIMTGDINYILNRGGVMLGFTLLSATFAIVSGLVGSHIGTLLGRNVRGAVFSRIEEYSLHEFNRIGTASLITRTTNDITQLQNVTVMGFRFILFAPIMCIGGFVMAYAQNASLLRILAVSVCVLLTFMICMIRFAMPLFKSQQIKIDRLNLTLRESLTGVRVIRAFDKMDFDKRKFAVANTELTGIAISINRIMAVMQPVMMLVMTLTSLSITWFGGNLISNGELEIGGMMAFTQYAVTILFSLLMVAMMFVMIPRAQASALRVLEVLEMPREINDPNSPQKPASGGHVEFKDVSFSYEGAEESMLKDITFEAKPGEITAIIGGTGAGKSSLISLIPRFYDATTGEVLVGGINVKNMAQSDLRTKIGFVAQGDVLFSGTIADNIRFGKKDATDDEIERAAKIAQAYDFIMKMPDGFNTQISQGGTNVSGGQKQRLAIARALVRQADIYIFDDSFSALDFKTDSRLRAALKSEIKDAAVLIVAQRISTVMDADKILVLDDGKIVGIGTHAELMQSSDIYREIVGSQLSEEEIA